jgi:Tfp pilus assembly protein PilN
MNSSDFMKTINLLPKSEQKELKLELISQKLLVFWIVVIVSLLGFFALTVGARFYLTSIIKETDKQIVENQKVLESSDYRDLQKEISTLNSNIKEIKNIESQHVYWSKALVELSNLIPPTMQLNQVTIDSASGKVTITGQAVDRESVIGLWASVIKSEYFKNIDFPLSNLEKAKNANFNYTFYVNKDKFKQE